MHNRGDFGCGHYGHEGHHGHGMASHHGSGRGCCCGGGFTSRHFYSREEMISHLENYLEQLRAETKGVEEHLEHLKTAGAKS